MFTRFPPEPNGYLHVGHIKAALIDFEKHKECKCYLRFDDTNPEKEKQSYADQIIKDITIFLGYKPYKITYTSDYFPQLITFAQRLIDEGKAYVDFGSQEDIKKQRGQLADNTWGKPYSSSYRNQSIEEARSNFEKMIDGVYSEKECCLRLKMDPLSTNPNMRDLVAYTIKRTPHFRTKTKYCVYPTYDFAHCIVDALENIDYSYCSLEFASRQESYYWLLDQLHLKNPVVYEFSRLNVTGSVLSKRKIKKLIDSGQLNDYDDPRLLTIAGLQRRGYTASALLNAVRQVGHTRNTSSLSIALLEHYIRQELNLECDRIFGLLDFLVRCIQ
jgi:glutaminyl-tRNA synthetase